MSPVYVDGGGRGVHIDIDALCAFKDGDYVGVDIGWEDAVALRDRLDWLIRMKEDSGSEHTGGFQ